jgi:hypothetical protein
LPQGLDHRAFAERPVMEIGVAQNNLAPALARGARQGVTHQLLKSHSAFESS